MKASINEETFRGNRLINYILQLLQSWKTIVHCRSNSFYESTLKTFCIRIDSDCLDCLAFTDSANSSGIYPSEPL